MSLSARPVILRGFPSGPADTPTSLPALLKFQLSTMAVDQVFFVCPGGPTGTPAPLPRLTSLDFLLPLRLSTESHCPLAVDQAPLVCPSLSTRRFPCPPAVVRGLPPAPHPGFRDLRPPCRIKALNGLCSHIKVLNWTGTCSTAPGLLWSRPRSCCSGACGPTGTLYAPVDPPKPGGQGAVRVSVSGQWTGAWMVCYGRS